MTGCVATIDITVAAPPVIDVTVQAPVVFDIETVGTQGPPGSPRTAGNGLDVVGTEIRIDIASLPFAP